MSRLLIILFPVLFMISSCTVDDGKYTKEQTLLYTAEGLAEVQSTKNDIGEQMTISVTLDEHSMSITYHNDNNATSMPIQNQQELEGWWDSLPKPIQSQVLANEVDIEVVSNIRVSDSENLNSEKNDQEVEGTGEKLEKIIGAPTDIRYSMSTTFVDDGVIKDTVRKVETKIQLVKKVPVNLNDFSQDISLDKDGFSPANIQTLQYWWNYILEEDIRRKIKAQDLSIELRCLTIDDRGIDSWTKDQLEIKAQENASMARKVLDNLIGVDLKNNTSMAKIDVYTEREVLNKDNVKFMNNQYINIRLRNKKNKIDDVM